MADLKMSITNCAKSLADARAEYESADARHKISEREKTDAKNKLNEAQKTFDAAVDELRANAPWDTKWSNPPQRACG